MSGDSTPHTSRTGGAHTDDGTDSTKTTGQGRRRFLVTTGAASTVGLAGCLGSITGGGGPLSIALEGGAGALVRGVLEGYIADQVDVDFEITMLPYANLFEKLVSTLSNEDTTYDMFTMDDPWLPRLARHLAAVDDHVENIPTGPMIDTTVEIGTWPPPRGPVVPSAQGTEQKLVALPAIGNTQLFVYNKRLYDEVGAGEPKTWQDVVETGRKITEQVDGSHGYVIRGQRGNPVMANFFGLGMSVGGNMFDDKWRYDWADPDGYKAYEMFTRSLRDISPEGVTSFDSEQVLNRLADGRAAAAPQWPSGASVLLDPEKAKEYDNLRFIPMPKGKRRAPQQGNWMLGINNYSSDAKKQDAATLMKEFVSKEAQDRYVTEQGGVPFRHDTFKNHMDATPWMQALYVSLQNAQWRPRTPLWNEIEVTNGNYLNTALVDEMSPKEAADGAKKEIENILSNNGYYG